MSIVSLFYLDNPVARNWIKCPYFRRLSHNYLLTRYGQAYNLISSFYLFFEYFGLREIFLKTLVNSPFKDIKSIEKAESKIEQIGKHFEKEFDDIKESKRRQLLEKKPDILDKIKKEETSNSEEYKELFKPFIDQINSNYDEFCDIASFFLAWDEFCSLQPSGINHKILRQTQLGVWNQIREQTNLILPIGKIVGGLTDLKRGSAFGGGYDDMVDSEGITMAVLQGAIFITYDSPEAIEERIKCLNEIVRQLESTLKISIPRKSGLVICFSRPSKKPNKIEHLKTIDTTPTIYI